MPVVEIEKNVIENVVLLIRESHLDGRKYGVTSVILENLSRNDVFITFFVELELQVSHLTDRHNFYFVSFVDYLFLRSIDV